MADDSSTRFPNTEVRHAFIRKVYTILMIQFIFTAVAVAIIAFVEKFKIWLLEHTIVSFIMFFILIVLTFQLLCCRKCVKAHPNDIVFLIAFTICSTWGLCSLVVYYPTDTVLLALVLIALLFLILTVFAIQTTIDFTQLKGFMAVAVYTLLALVIINLIFSLGMRTVLVCFAVAVYAVYTIYMTQLIMSGRRYEIGPEDYFYATIMLYVCAVIPFFMVLNLIGIIDD